MSPKRRLVFSLVHAAAFCFAASLCADEAPDPEDIAAAGRRTQERLEREPASWTTVFELGGVEAHVLTTLAPSMRRFEVSFQDKGERQFVARIIERDGSWYVASAAGHFKYRPYEAPLGLPALYVFLARSELRLLLDGKEPVGKFVRMEGPIAVYRGDIPEPLRKQLQSSLDQLSMIEKTKPDQISEQLRETMKKLQRALEEGVEFRINTQSGIAIQQGEPGKRVWIKDFQWLRKTDKEAFDVGKQTWSDRTSSIFKHADSPNDVVMILNSAIWRPGDPAGDTEALLLNITTGETRRLPYKLGNAAYGCFSADRKRAFVSGDIFDDGRVAVVEIDLLTGKHRFLGGPVLQTGFTMFPTLSPNGKELAVVHMEPEAGPFYVRVHIIDIATGNSKPLGEPLDAGSVSWLPTGDGIVLESREYKSPDKPPVCTICRMDTSGKLTPIRNGQPSLVILSQPRILFRENDGRQWKTCDLSGENVELLGDGLESFGFPTQSPDGKRLIMMKFGGPKGPQPHVIDIATGKATPIPVGPGLWTYPRWR